MRCFRGVYAIDTLSHHTACSTYICNLDTHDKPGSHWIALYVPSEASKPIEYFDSYGFDAPIGFKDFLTYMNREYYVCNTRTIQHFGSSVCGQYALYYVWQRPIASSMDNVLNIFESGTTLYNDVLVNDIVESHFAVDLNVFDETFINQFV